jgi:hypothetical protein
MTPSVPAFAGAFWVLPLSRATVQARLVGPAVVLGIPIIALLILIVLGTLFGSF